MIPELILNVCEHVIEHFYISMLVLNLETTFFTASSIILHNHLYFFLQLVKVIIQISSIICPNLAGTFWLLSKLERGVEGLKFTVTTPAAYTRLMTVNYPTHLNMTF